MKSNRSSASARSVAEKWDAPLSRSGASEIARKHAGDYRKCCEALVGLRDIIERGLEFYRRRYGEGVVGGLVSRSGADAGVWSRRLDGVVEKGYEPVRLPKKTLVELLGVYTVLQRHIVDVFRHMLLSGAFGGGGAVAGSSVVRSDFMQLPRLEDYTNPLDPDVMPLLMWDRDSHLTAVYRYGARPRRRGWFANARPRRQAPGISEYRLAKDSLLDFLRSYGVAEHKIEKWLQTTTSKGNSITFVLPDHPQQARVNNAAIVDKQAAS